MLRRAHDPRAALVTLTLAATLVAGACTVGGDGSSDADDGPTTTLGPVAPADASGLPDDVPDESFPNLGDPRLDVESYDVEITTEPGADEIEGVAELVLRSATGKALPSFTLDLRGPEVSEATVDGEEARVTPGAENEIIITPASPIEADEDVRVRLTYSGEPDQSIFPALGMGIGWQSDGEGGSFTMSQPDGTATWVPVNDHPSDKATWEVTFDVPEGTTAVGSGRLQGGEPEVDDGRARWTWVEEEPMAPYLVLAAVGDYELITRSVGGVEAVFAVPEGMPQEQIDLFEEHDEIIPFFEELFGPYPNDDTGAIVVPTDLEVAFESQTRSLFGQDAVEGAAVWALAHEIAHQWFGNSVTVETWDDLWLNEGFATYADWLWRDHTGIQTLDDQVGAVLAERAGSGLAVTDPAAAATFDLAVYEGGALALHALRLEVGDEAFFEILQRWARENEGGNVTTDDFVDLASEVAGEDLEAFILRWLGEDTPAELPG